MPSTQPVTWHTRAEPLAPRAAAARDQAALRLARRLVAFSAEHLATYEGVATPTILLVLGANLPWTDGVIYLGRDPAAPSLLLPTTLAPNVPSALLAAKFGGAALALIPQWQMMLTL